MDSKKYLTKHTEKTQNLLAEYCRNKKQKGVLDNIDSYRLSQYRRLIYNVFNDVLEQAYPITKSVLSPKKWDKLIAKFLRKNHPKENEFWKMPKDFIQFIQDNDYNKKLKKPYLTDLVLFEWIEIEVFCMMDIKLPKYNIIQNDINDIMDFKLFINPYFMIQNFEYPVFKEETKKCKKQKGNYFLIVYREIDTFKVRFLEFTFFTYNIFLNLSNGNSFSISLQKTCERFKVDQTPNILIEAQNFLNILIEKRLVLGSLK